MALDDCGLSIRDMQALYCGNLGQAGALVGQRVLKEIGQTGIPVVNVANACATGATAFRDAWIAIKAGLYDLVLAVGVEQMGKGMLGGAGPSDGISPEGILGSYSMPATFAHMGMEHARKYGTTFEQFAKRFGEEPSSLHAQPESDVSEGNAARRSDEVRDDVLSEHEAHVLGECGRLGRGGVVFGKEGEGIGPA